MENSDIQMNERDLDNLVPVPASPLMHISLTVFLRALCVFAVRTGLKEIR
jgi:hypothetical protein